MVVECAEVSLFCWVVLLVICYIINFLLIGWWENVFLFLRFQPYFIIPSLHEHAAIFMHVSN